MRIGLLSDTHGYLDEGILKHLHSCDEIWHAGDIGTKEVTDQLASIKPIRAVYGNIDGNDLRKEFPEDNRFTCEGVDVLMTHIGGYPGRYSQHASQLIRTAPPKLFICGHSHILKILSDKKFGLLHMNPGAAGHHGFHIIRTMIRFSIDDTRIHSAEVIELGRRGAVI